MKIKMIKEWIENLNERTFKNYTHFDINKTFKNPQEKIYFFEDFFANNNISKYRFKPFIRQNIKEKKFIKHEDENPNNNFFYKSENKNSNLYWHKEKIRPITYASHMDSYIYSYYSFLLWDKYKNFLHDTKLEKNILAYRTVEKIHNGKKSGKNNIDFSLDTFQDILNSPDSIVCAFDISWFFDNLNHNILKQELIKILWDKSLSKDWYKIYKNITKFCYVEKNQLTKYNLIERLNTKHRFPKKINIEKFNSIKKSNKLIHTNNNNFWIPQGTPISWMLANLYMSSFDVILKEYSEKLNWKYYRYSDDILLIIPYHEKELNINMIKDITGFIEENINKICLKINNKKTEICIFQNKKIIHNIEFKDNCYVRKKNIIPFQYLWFTFDGNRVLIREKTLSNHYKKMIQSIKRLHFLKDDRKDKDWNILWENYIKWDKILLWKHNRKYLYNWVIKWKRYKKKEWKYKIDILDKDIYLWFLSYGYYANSLFDNFCKSKNITNWIKKQLSWHKNKYNKLLKKYWIKN